MAPSDHVGFFGILRTFLRLGCTSVGGPMAHIGFFRETFVRRRGWLDEAEFARLLALCQFLPGPTSSQLGLLIGHRRGGLPGALAAWLGFTLPSLVMMISAALWLAEVGRGPLLVVLVHGIELAVLAVVIHAARGMAASLCPDLPRGLIGLGTGAVALLLPGTWSQVLALGIAAGAGLFLRDLPAGDMTAETNESACHRGRFRGGLSVGFIGITLVGFIAALVVLGDGTTSAGARLLAANYQAGSLVFGGGHVVLPLLHQPLVTGGLLSEERFLAGYGLAQLVPGPLFTVAGFHGATVAGEAGLGSAGAVVWGVLAAIALFLPGALLALACVGPFARFSGDPRGRRIVAGVCAGTVGLLGAAAVDPLARNALHGIDDVAVVVVALLLLIRFRWGPFAVIGCCLVATWAMAG